MPKVALCFLTRGPCTIYCPDECNTITFIGTLASSLYDSTSGRMYSRLIAGMLLSRATPLGGLLEAVDETGRGKVAAAKDRWRGGRDIVRCGAGLLTCLR